MDLVEGINNIDLIIPAEIVSMGTIRLIEHKEPPHKSIVEINCRECNTKREVSVEAVTKQRKRGREHYLCPSCAGRKAWTPAKKKIARKRSLQKWQNPNYAGTITGKAMAKQVIQGTNSLIDEL